MVYSLTHLTVLALPQNEFDMTEKEKCVLNNVEWDANRLVRQYRTEEADLIDDCRQIRYDYNDLMQAEGHHPHPKTNVKDDMEVISLDLFNTYDTMIDYRNQISAEGLWSRNFIYMDWIIVKCFCCPKQTQEFEEMYHMLKGSLLSWSRLKPEFDSGKYTGTELELYSFIASYYRLCESSFKTMERHQVPAFDKIWEHGKRLVDITLKLDECQAHIKFYKSVVNSAARVAPRYKPNYEFRNPEALDIDDDFDANEAFESLLPGVAQS